MATKKILQVVTLNLEAGDAGLVDLGKMLGPTGVNLRAVKAEYDAATTAQRGEVVPVVVTVYEDRSYTLRYKTPPTAWLIRRALGLDRGSATPGSRQVGTLTRAQLREIALRKLPDLTTTDVEKAMQQVAGTARSMGVRVAD
ncbi:MAG: 50S ribosomal protein L11 [Micromonosporaceae bacterium]